MTTKASAVVYIHIFYHWHQKHASPIPNKRMSWVSSLMYVTDFQWANGYLIQLFYPNIYIFKWSQKEEETKHLERIMIVHRLVKYEGGVRLRMRLFLVKGISTYKVTEHKLLIEEWLVENSLLLRNKINTHTFKTFIHQKTV